MSVQREMNAEAWLKTLGRRRWLLILPAILGALAGLLTALIVPRQYTSQTTVLVEEPEVPDAYVKPVVSDDLNQRLASMQGQILSRTRLQHLIQEFHLYAKDSDRVLMEVLVERLRKAIKVTPLSTMPGTLSRSLPGFHVDVTYQEPRIAQAICNEITSMFMEQNVHLREAQSEDTTRFLTQQLAEAKSKLDEQDAKLADYQSRFLGEQPGDENANLTLLTGMSTQLEAATQNLNQADQQKAFVESMLNQEVASWKATAEGHGAQSLQQQLSALQSQLTVLRAQYTELHPSVVRVKNEIADLQRKIRQAPAAAAATPEEDVGDGTDARAESPQIQQLRAQLHEVNLSIRQRKQEQSRIERRIKELQARIQISPKVQEGLKSLTRDYQTALGFYNDLLKKQKESQMATELELRQQSEHFRVLDPPSLPERPSFPNPRLFTLGGLGGGLILGAALVQLAEMRDKSLRTARDVELFLRVPAIAVISSLHGPQPGKTETRFLALKSAALERQRFWRA